MTCLQATFDNDLLKKKVELQLFFYIFDLFCSTVYAYQLFQELKFPTLNVVRWSD